MSERSSGTELPSEIEVLKRELAEKIDLVQSVRKELVLSQITVLELQDTVLQKETDKADAISILGQVELVLEGKINYIVELDRVLNAKLSGLQREFSATQTSYEQDRLARDKIAQDLVAKLDEANRALGAAHALAGNYARDASETGEKLQAALRQLAALQSELAAAAVLSSNQQQTIATTQNQLAECEAARASAERRLAEIYHSFAWKITAPFRAIFTRKS